MHIKFDKEKLIKIFLYFMFVFSFIMQSVSASDSLNSHNTFWCQFWLTVLFITAACIEVPKMITLKKSGLIDKDPLSAKAWRPKVIVQIIAILTYFILIYCYRFVLYK